MNTVTNNKTPEREEIESLLPWHAAGTLSRRDAQRVEDALRADPELGRRYNLVREELGETIHVNETLGAPSSRAMERLLAGIEQESGPARQARPRFSFTTWMAETLSGFSARKLAWAATAGAVAIVVQAGLLAGLYMNERTGPEYRSVQIGPYGTAAQPPVTEVSSGTFAFIGFVPQATSADVTTLLAANDVVLVDGPRAGGLYRARLAPKPLSKDEVGAITNKLRANRAVVSFIAPAE